MDANQEDLRDRLNLIESMIQEGRRRTESWGWAFVLWGAAYLIALGWSTSSLYPALAWPVTMLGAVAAMLLKIYWRSRGGTKGRSPETTVGRAVGAVWTATGISMFVLLFSLAITKQVQLHAFVAIVAAMLGTANAGSSMILKWRLQFGCAVVWWAAGVAACFGSDMQVLAVFVGAIFLCQIVFGIYCMIGEARERRQRKVMHA